MNERTTDEDIAKFTGSAARHVIVIEADWLEKLRTAVLYLYEFDPENFERQDAAAGYYVSTKTVLPIRKIRIDDLPLEIRRRGAQLRIAENLHPIADKIRNTSFDWSLCRMAFAKKSSAALQE